MNGEEVIQALKKKFRAPTDQALASRIGMTVTGIHRWKTRPNVTLRQLAELVFKTNGAGSRDLQNSAIRPLVEFFPIDRARQKTTFVLFSSGSRAGGGGNITYRAGLKAELDAHFGVYIFFDSRGQAIYTGKARKQTLWKEMNLAFNRDRGDIQKIKRVRHPERNQAYKTTNEKTRQITDHIVPIHELARYFSAYHVAEGMIGDVEAMLVRSFANDLLNKRMERFGQQRKIN